MKKIILGLLAATTLAGAASAGSLTIYNRGGFDTFSNALGTATEYPGGVTYEKDHFGWGWCSPPELATDVGRVTNISNGGQITYSSDHTFSVQAGPSLHGYNPQTWTVNPDDKIFLVYKGTIFKAFLDVYHGSVGNAAYDTCP